MSDPALLNSIEALTGAQLRQVLGRVMLELGNDEAPVTDEGEGEERLAQYAKWVEAVAGERNIVSGEREGAGVPTAKRFLVALADTAPEYSRMVTDAIDEAIAPEAVLDFGVSAFALNAVVLAIAGAILQPSIEYEDRSTKSGSRIKKLSIRLGTKKIDAILKAVLPFLK